MENNKILSALSYFSVLFAPFILPIIVFFVSQDKEVKHHAKRSLISHLVPFIFMVIIVISMFSSIFSMSMSMTYNEPSLLMTSAPIIFMLLYLVIYVVILIWNVIQGVKVLR